MTAELVWRANRSGRIRHLFTVPAPGKAARARCGYSPASGALPASDDRGMITCARCVALGGGQILSGAGQPPGAPSGLRPSVLAADAAWLLAAEMKRQDITTAELGRRLGMTTAAIGQILRGANRPSLSQLDRVFAALGVVARITLEAGDPAVGKPSALPRRSRTGGHSSQHE